MHANIMTLVDSADATHVAINSGSWNNPNTWAAGNVPGDGARVIISSGVDVRYDAVSDARLFTVGVEGNLDFSTTSDTRMIVDTMVVGHSGKLTVGTLSNPVADGVTADIIFANNGDIDVSWDGSLVSRGLVALGDVEIHGQEKLSHIKVATDPMAGDTTLELAGEASGWEVGDTIILAGTRYDGYAWDNVLREVRHYLPEDEVRTITGISGNTITFDQALVFDHDAPRADLKTSVANYTRNVTFSTEDADTAQIHERGHVMFHSRDTDVRYAAFEELGRTDKDEPALTAPEFSDIAADSNVKGRYPLHFHRNGVDNPEDAAIAVGNAIYGSPGWGLVHHDSNVNVAGNATYNTFGAGYVAETGNEIGVWSDNIAIYAKGESRAAPKNGVDLENFDTGKTGDGFWFQGRMVKAEDNIAASVNRGFVYFHRGTSTDDGSEPGNINIFAEQFDLPEALGGLSSLGPDDAPILGFSGNEAFAATEGLHVVKANPNQGHDVHSQLEDFTAWSVRTGAHFEYTSHYIIKNFDAVAREDRGFNSSTDGISLGNNTTDMIIINQRAENFKGSGIDLSKSFTNDNLSFDLKKFVVVDQVSINNATDLANYDPAFDTIIDTRNMPASNFSVDIDGPLTYREGWPDPTARKVEISGTKTDSLGTVPIPAGTDQYNASIYEVINILETDGWYTTAAGERVFFLEDYYTDRLTGEVFKVVEPVYIDDNVQLGNQHHAYANAVYRGEVDLNSAAPVAIDETIDVIAGQDTIIDVTANDSDAEGAAVTLDGIVQPLHGQIFENGDGTITYRPFVGHTGSQTVKYWVKDDAGQYASAYLTINVGAQTSSPIERPEPVVERPEPVAESPDPAMEPVTTAVERFDTADLYSWTSYMDVVDETGVRLSRATTYDDGREAINSYTSGVIASRSVDDRADAFIWTKVDISYDSTGQREQQTNTYDNGRVLVSDYLDGVRIASTMTDAGDARSWFSSSNSFDASGARVSGTTLYDDGREAVNTYTNGTLSSRNVDDKANAFIWSSVDMSYDANGARTQTTKTYDNGRVLVTDFANSVRSSSTMTDMDDIYSWASFTDTFDTKGDRTERSMIFDDGREVITSYVDQADLG